MRHAPLILVTLLAGCAPSLVPLQPDADTPGPVPSLELPPCEDAFELCSGADCPTAPTSVEHAEWWARLTSSPPITWTGGGPRIQLSVGTAPGETDVFCWTDADSADGHVFRALELDDGATYYVNARTVDGERASPSARSEGWTVDVAPPEPPSQVDDALGPTTGVIRWEAAEEDAESGFAGYRFAIGTAPSADDVVAWQDVPAGSKSFDLGELELEVGTWLYANVVTRDAAGARSAVVASAGFMRCPDNFVFVPANDTMGIRTGAFCAAVYEMRVRGSDDGDVIYDGSQVPESRPSGTPWVNMNPSLAATACGTMGEGYGGITNVMWQAIARSIEANPRNWSGGAVGDGLIPRGHCDREPEVALASDEADPCFGTGNPACEDPSSEDYGQRRTHYLANEGLIWDVAGNVWETTTGSMGGFEGLWQSFDADAFTVDERAEEFTAAFAPAGPYTEEHGMGRMYGGNSGLVRGGAFSGYRSGVGGSRGALDVGVFAAFHKMSSYGNSVGFRCSYAP